MFFYTNHLIHIHTLIYVDKIYGPSDNNDKPTVAIDGVRKCRVGVMRLCVTSEPEMAKCVRMRTALNAQLLEPKMSCKKAPSAFHCMKLISNNDADTVVLDAGDVYRYVLSENILVSLVHTRRKIL